MGNTTGAPELMDGSTACKVLGVAGVIYGIQTYVLPKMWLKGLDIAGSDDEVFLSRGVGAGIISMTSMAGMAATRGADTQEAALCSLSTGFILFNVNSALRAMSKPDCTQVIPSVPPQIHPDALTPGCPCRQRSTLLFVLGSSGCVSLA